MLDGVPIIVAPLMAGAKRAVKMDGKVYVSPAMYSLMRSANDRELEFILAHLGLVSLDVEHDAQWHADTLQINAAMFDDMLARAESSGGGGGGEGR